MPSKDIAKAYEDLFNISNQRSDQRDEELKKKLDEYLLNSNFTNNMVVDECKTTHI